MNHFTTGDRYFAKHYTKYGVIPTDEELPYKASDNSASGKYVHPDEDNNKGKSNKHMKQKQTKQTIKLNESQLRNIIKESIKMVLKENMEPKPPFFWSISELRDTGNGFESYRCVEDSATSDYAVQDKFDTPEDAYQDGLKNLKYYNEGDYELEVYYFTPNGAGDYVPGYMAEIHNGSITEY